MSIATLMTFGERLRKLRELRDWPQRKVAASLDIDTSLYAKYERDERQPSNDIIVKIANLFVVDYSDLIVEAFTDKIAYQILEKELDTKILRVAEEKVAYLKNKKITPQ